MDFPAKEVEVDHMVGMGKGLTWDEFINRLFCEATNLQVLCKPCHKEKSAKEKIENQQSVGATGRVRKVRGRAIPGGN
jgi:hypothetical protein